MAKAEKIPQEAVEEIKQEMTISQKAQSLVMANGVQFKVARKVTLPLLKQRDGEQVAFTILEPMKLGKQLKAKQGEELPKRAMMLTVKDLQSNTEMAFIVPAVLQDVLETDYANDAYVNKSFAILKMPKAEGKRHKDLQIVEIELA